MREINWHDLRSAMHVFAKNNYTKNVSPQREKREGMLCILMAVNFSICKRSRSSNYITRKKQRNEAS